MRKHLFLIPFLLVSVLVRAEEASAPKPTFNVSFERPSIRENDCVPVELWFSNDGKIEISEVTVQLASPYFLKFYQSKCGLQDQNVVDKITLPARQLPSVYHATLYLKSEPRIAVGDYTLLFTAQYQWKSEKQQRHSIITLEKPIKVNFLGSESVAGVPLGLAGLIVPGLCFWLVIRLFGISWGVETGLGDKLIYSVVMSFIFVGLASILSKYFTWLQNLDVSAGISITKLIWLAGSGIVVGVVVGVFETWRRKRRLRKAAAVQINVDDDDSARLEKLLKLNPTYNPSVLRRFFRKLSGEQTAPHPPQTTVILKDDRFSGSLGVKQGELTTLAGWFKVTKGDAGGEVVAELEDLATKGDLLALLQRAKEEKLTIAGRDSVKQKSKTGPGSDSTSYTKQWGNSEVLQLVVESDHLSAKPSLTVTDE